MPNSDRRNSSQQSQQINENQYYDEEHAYTLPPNGLTRAIIIGIIGGIVALAIPVLIVLINSTLFREGSRLGDNMPSQVATSILAWQCAGVFVDLIIAFVVGMVAGRAAVKRWQGALAGALVGAIVYIGIFFVHYIPGYPDIIGNGAKTGASGTVAQGILAFIIALIIYMLAAGLMGLWGAWMTTRRHPYYHSQPKE